MITLTHSPFLKALGWSLLNSLWQFGILWLFFILFLHTRKKSSPALQHGLALVLTSTGMLWFAAGLSFQYFTYQGSSGAISSMHNFEEYAFCSVILSNIKTFLENNLSYFSMLYLLIVAGFFSRFFRFFFSSYVLKTKGLRKIKPELRLYVQRMVQHLNIGRTVGVWITEYIDTPMVIGFIKPVILVPVACINQLSIQQIEAILLHELAHIKRNDYLVNLYIATLEILFFFNPFTGLLIKCLKQEREKSCDDWVLQFRFDPYQYASALLSLEQNRSASYSLTIAAAGENKNSLLQRVQRIMGIKKSDSEPGFKILAYFITVGLLSFIALTDSGSLVAEDHQKSYVEFNLPTASFTNELKQLSLNSIVSAIHPKPEIQNRKKKTVSAIGDQTLDKRDAESVAAMPASIDVDFQNELPQLALLQSTINENKDFSIKEKDPELPEAAKESEFPFVPNSSYSYYNTQDTTIIKLKAEKYNDQAIRQSLAQTQKAIEKLNWNNIARLQKLSKASVINLQRELQQSLHSLNWSQIYKETMDSINKASTGDMRSSLKQEYDKMNNYKAMQQQYELIKMELLQQQERYKKGAETELKEIEKQVKKAKVIVYI